MRIVLLLLALGGVAHADGFQPPAGWVADSKTAVSLSKRLGDMPHFGGLRSVVVTEVFQTTGASLYVTKMSASIAGLDEAARNKAASAQLDEVMVLAPARMIGKAITEASDAKDSANPHALEGTHRWHDSDTKITSNSRIVIAADAQQLVAVIGECLLAADVAKDVDAVCAASLATLDPYLAPASRVDLAIVKSPAPAPAPASPGSGPSLVDSGERPSLAPMEIPQAQREPDRRPIYVGLGLIVLAAIMYWNRKNRQKLERDYEQRSADKQEQDKETKPAPARGDDGDDLHAAAAEAADDGARNSDTKEQKS